MADNDNDVQALPNSTIFNGILKVRKDVNSPWQSIPAIKGASTSIQIADYSDSDTYRTGKTITIINNYDTEAASSASFVILNGADGTGTVNQVDGVEPAGASKNVALQAVRYVEQELSSEQKNQALTNIGAVPISRTVNNKALSSNITLTAADINAVPTTRTINGYALDSDISLTAANINAVPTTRTINGYALDSDISLTAADVSALSTISQIHITKPNVDVISWASTTAYNDYPYRGTISIPGVTSAMIPNVIFSWEQIESGNFSPIVETDTDAVYIYAESQPADTITIPAVICFI